MELFLIRHAEAEHNVDFLKYGEDAYYFEKNRFSPITFRGLLSISNARKTCPTVDLVISSSLPRTLLTSYTLFLNSNVPVYVTDIVREANFHHPCNQRQNKSTIQAVYPDFHLDFLYNDQDLDFQGGIDNLTDRLEKLDMLLQFFRSHGFQRIAIVTHQTFLEAYFRQKMLPPLKLDNCQIVSVKYNSSYGT